MAIIVNLDRLLAERGVQSKELAQFVGITEEIASLSDRHGE